MSATDELTDEQVEVLATAIAAKLEERLARLVRPRRLLRTPEAAELLGVPTARLARWAWRGEIPSVKLTDNPNGWRYFEPTVIENIRRGGQQALAQFSDNRKVAA